jgi:hypothetical protein
VSATDSGPNTDASVVKIAMLSMKSQNWGELCLPYGSVLCDLVVCVVTDIGSQCQGSPLVQDIDPSCASEFRVPGSFPVPTIRGRTSVFKPFLPTDHGDTANSTLPDSSRFKHATGYFIALAIQRFPCPTPIVLSVGKIRNELSSIWSSLSKFAYVERNTLMTAVVVM